MEGRVLLATFTVTDTNDDMNMGSLRYAITQSNATPGSNTIDFNIATMGVQTIDLLSALPAITVPVTIDGTTERGYNGTPIIELDGAGAGKGVDGLDISAGKTTVEGLAINRFTGEGINLSVAGSDTITKDFLGTDPTGTTAEGNGLDGILVQANSNSNLISNNLISGNTNNGIYLNGSTFAQTTFTTGNLITGNLVGTDVTGTATLGNGEDGLYEQNAPMTTVGGTIASARNVFSGNGTGMELYDNSDGTVIEGNYVGTDATGSVALGNNGPHGFFDDNIVFRGISNSTIGGTAAGAGNVISGGSNYGIDCFVIGSGNLTIEGNLIGTDASGTKALGNKTAGINIAGPTGVTIGGTVAGARNVISGNTGDGITTFAGNAGLVIEGNLIGTDITGTQALGNGGDGIHATFNGITIGGLAAGAGNIIANNGATGPFDRSGVEISSTGIPVLSNSIYNNQNLGIDLNGGNNAQAAPALSSAETSLTNSTVAGTLTTADGTYTVQFFASPTLNPSGNAEGETLLGTASVTVVGGSANFTETLTTPFTPGEFITATATSATNGTSEFSQGIMGTQEPIPPTISVATSAPSVPVGQQVTDTFTITNPATVADDAGLVFSDTLPAGVTFVSGTTSVTGVPVIVSGGVALANIGTLAAGQSVTVMLVLSPTLAAEPSFTDTGEITATTPPITSGTITASVTIQVLPTADLSVSIAGPASGAVLINQDLVYTVTATNNGPSPASGVVLTNTLPANVMFVSAISSSGEIPTEMNGTVVDSLPLLAAGATEVLTITVIPTAAAVPMVSDSALVMANEFDPNVANNSFSLVTAVNPIADLAINSLTASPTPVAAGNTITFTILVVNDGPSLANGVVVTDTLPTGLTFVSGTADGGTVSDVGGVVTAPVGTLGFAGTSIVTIVALASMAGTFSNTSTVSSGVADPDLANNSASVVYQVTPVADIAVAISGTAGPVYTNTVLTYTAVVANAGPSPATNVLFADPLPAGTSFVAVGSGGLVGSVVNGVVELDLGTIGVGASMVVTLVIIPTAPGVITNTAMVAANEPDPDLANNSSSVSTSVIVPQSFITFSSTNYAVADNAGFAAITLVRSNYFADDVTVHFSTAGGIATPGVDYEPVSETVDFPAGSTEASVIVPVIDNPYNNHNQFVGLEIDSPTGSGVLIAGQTTALLTIIDIDPDLVGPTVTALKLTGYVNSITSIEIDTTGGLNPSTATNPANYTITAYGGPAKGALPLGTDVPVASATYNAATGAVTLTPSQPLPGNELFLVVVNGNSPGAVSDLAGNPLNSVYGVKPGSDYLLSVARGTDIVYPNENGDPVTLKLTGPGTIDIDRYVAGDLEILQVVGGVANKTVITGTVHPTLQRSKIGTILGIGQFGSIRVKMTTPPFYVANTPYPNINTQVDAPAIDTLLPTPPVTTTPKSKGKKAATTSKHSQTSTAHAAKAHAEKVHAAKAHAEAPKPAARHHR